MRKSQEVTARQLLGWITRTLPRISYNTGDGTVSIYAGRGWAHSQTDDPAAVLDALRACRLRDIRERAQIRRDKREGVWPYSLDAAGRVAEPPAKRS